MKEIPFHFCSALLKFDWLLSRNIKILLTARYAKRFTLHFDDLGFFYKVPNVTL